MISLFYKLAHCLKLMDLNPPLIILSIFNDNNTNSKKVCMTVAKNEITEFEVVKGTIPKSLKIQFKVFCVQQSVEMSEVLEALIRQWIQTDAPISQLPHNLALEELEELKGYVPKILKHRFKSLCKQKRVTMRSVLYALIIKLLETDNFRE